MSINKSITAASPSVVISIVSHGHIELIQNLLMQLAHSGVGYITRVVVTKNIPESELEEPSTGWPFILQTIVNSKPLGFGENHNRALLRAKESWVCILNPDVELIDGEDVFTRLLDIRSDEVVGCIYPSQTNESGALQESERELPTPCALWRRRVLKRGQQYVDWVNGAFLLIPTAKWQQLNGFDSSYYMYCEDVDLCLRIRLHGWQLVKADVTVVHGGQHASSKKWRHLMWHVSSLLRLWTSPTFWKYLRLKNRSSV